jgi:hypothetical protein
MIVPPKRTKHFVFTRTNPSTKDYNHLIATCQRFNMNLTFKTVLIKKGARLVGFIMLRHGLSTQQRMAHFFKNFLITRIPKKFEDGFQWMDSITGICDGPVFYDYKGHPYDFVIKQLEK